MPKSGPIIIIEDDRDDQEVLKEVFDDLKIPNLIRFFNTCLEALNYLKDTVEKPFLIISDINLPIMNGIELKNVINQNNSLRIKTIPFIFLSTTSENGSILKAYETSANGYFIKPVRLNEIKELMTRIIDYWRFAAVPA